MFLFSLGTVPLMLGLGSIVSALGRKFTQKVMCVGAVLVIVLGLAMLSQGGSLSGLLLPKYLLILVIALSILGVVASIPFHKTWSKAVSLATVTAFMIAGGITWNRIVEINRLNEAVLAANKVEIENGVQVVNSTLESGSYPDITVQVGVPVKWVIDAPKGSINGCNYKILLKEYGIEYIFQDGENIIEFTPTKAGNYGYTCWMGMIHGNIYVTDGNGETTTITPEPVYNGYGIGDSCCGGGVSSKNDEIDGSCCGEGASSDSDGSGNFCCGE